MKLACWFVALVVAVTSGAPVALAQNPADIEAAPASTPTRTEEGLPPPPPPAFLDDDSRWQRTAAWLSVGVAAVLLTTGSVFGTSALSRQEDINRLVDFRDPTTGLPKTYAGAVRLDYESKADDIKKLNTLTELSFIGAGVAAGAAVLFFVMDRNAARHESRASAFVTPGGGGVTAAWDF